MALIGMLGVNQNHSGQGIGKGMVRDAVKRIASASGEMGIRGVMLHAVDDEAKSFYEHLGFLESSVEGGLMMVTLQQISASLQS